MIQMTAWILNDLVSVANFNIEFKLTHLFDNIFVFFFSGDHKTFFIPGLVGPFLEMTLIPHTGKASWYEHLEFELVIGRISKEKWHSHSPCFLVIDVSYRVHEL